MDFLELHDSTLYKNFSIFLFSEHWWFYCFHLVLACFGHCYLMYFLGKCEATSSTNGKIAPADDN